MAGRPLPRIMTKRLIRHKCIFIYSSLAKPVIHVLRCVGSAESYNVRQMGNPHTNLPWRKKKIAVKGKKLNSYVTKEVFDSLFL